MPAFAASADEHYRALKLEAVFLRTGVLDVRNTEGRCTHLYS